MVEVLVALGRLEVLRKYLLELLEPDPCLAKLKEIALREHFSNHHNLVREDRPVASLDEACYLGSEAAWLLKEYELMTKEYTRRGG
jgi:hypothetical protein